MKQNERAEKNKFNKEISPMRINSLQGALQNASVEKMEAGKA